MIWSAKAVLVNLGRFLSTRWVAGLAIILVKSGIGSCLITLISLASGMIG